VSATERFARAAHTSKRASSSARPSSRRTLRAAAARVVSPGLARPPMYHQSGCGSTQRRPRKTRAPPSATTSTSEHALTSASSARPYSSSGRNLWCGSKSPVTNCGQRCIADERELESVIT
jgi:hypothetical protein